MTNQKLQELLKDLIDKWLDERSTRNISFLSNRAKLSQQKLYRLNRGEKVDLDLIQLMRLLHVVATPSLAKEIYQQFFSEELELAVNIINEIDTGKANPGKFDNQVFDYLSKDPSIFIILTLCWKKDGASIGEIKRLVGPKYLEILDELTAADIISESQSGIYEMTDKSTRVTNNRETSLDCAIQGSEVLKRVSDKFMAISYTQGVSEEALIKINDVLQRAQKELGEIIINKQNQGNIPFIVNLSAGQITDFNDA